MNDGKERAQRIRVLEAALEEIVRTTRTAKDSKGKRVHGIAMAALYGPQDRRGRA